MIYVLKKKQAPDAPKAMKRSTVNDKELHFAGACISGPGAYTKNEAGRNVLVTRPALGQSPCNAKVTCFMPRYGPTPTGALSFVQAKPANNERHNDTSHNSSQHAKQELLHRHHHLVRDSKSKTQGVALWILIPRQPGKFNASSRQSVPVIHHAKKEKTSLCL